jgi:hypothetical protein
MTHSALFHLTVTEEPLSVLVIPVHSCPFDEFVSVHAIQGRAQSLWSPKMRTPISNSSVMGKGVGSI